MKKFFLLLCSIWVCLSGFQDVQASQRTSSITVDFEKEVGISVGIVQVGDIYEEGYVWRTPYSSVDVDLNSVQDAETLASLAMELETLVVKPQAIQKPDASGKMTFSGLQKGVYLIYMVHGSWKYEMNPMILSVPEVDPDTLQISYERTIYPKVSEYPILELRKADKDSLETIKQEGVEFTVYKDKETKEKCYSVQTDKNGVAKISLVEKILYFKETKAPDGYQILDEIFEVEMREDGLYVNDKKVNENKYDFMNSKTPETSVSFDIMIVLILMASSFLCIFLGLIIYKNVLSKNGTV